MKILFPTGATIEILAAEDAKPAGDATMFRDAKRKQLAVLTVSGAVVLSPGTEYTFTPPAIDGEAMHDGL